MDYATIKGRLLEKGFTERELQLAFWLMAGYTTGEMASRLYIGESTTKNSLVKLFKKCGVSGKVKFLVYCWHLYQEEMKKKEAARDA